MTQVYTWMNYAILAVVGTSVLAIVVLKLRFKLDLAALVIVFTQLTVMTARVF